MASTDGIGEPGSHPSNDFCPSGAMPYGASTRVNCDSLGAFWSPVYNFELLFVKLSLMSRTKPRFALINPPGP